MARKTSPQLDANTRICVLYGHEQMLMRIHLDQLRQALEADKGEVVMLTLDGKTASLAEVFDEVRGYSLLASYKIVVVDAADEFVKTHRVALQRYAAAPVDHATLVLRGDKWHKGNLDKLIVKVGAVIKCETPTSAQAVQWLIGRAKAEHGTVLSRPAAVLLVERLGPHLMQLDGELAKLALCVEPGEAIETDCVAQVVGRSSDEQAWAVQEAILQAIQAGDAGVAIGAVHELVRISRQPDVLVVYFVADVMRKLAVASAMQRAGMPDPAIARQLKLWGPRQQLFFAALRRLDGRRIRRAFDRIVQLDSRSKSGRGEPMRNLECFCVNLADLSIEP